MFGNLPVPKGAGKGLGQGPGGSGHRECLPTRWPEQLWLPLDPWQYPRPGWTLGLEQLGTVGGVPARENHSNLNHSVILHQIYFHFSLKNVLECWTVQTKRSVWSLSTVCLNREFSLETLICVSTTCGSSCKDTEQFPVRLIIKTLALFF